MTLRDEIAKALAASNSWMLAHECRDSADALLPIVERVARQVGMDAAMSGRDGVLLTAAEVANYETWIHVR